MDGLPLDPLTRRKIAEALQVVLNEGFGSVRIDVVKGKVDVVVTETSWKCMPSKKEGEERLFQ